MTTNTPKLRFKEFTDEWQEKKLGDIADIKGGKRIPKGNSLQTKNNGLPYITVSDMKNGSIDVAKIKYVPENIFYQIKNYTISKNDIYISVAGTLGLVGTIPITLDGANLTENANKLTNINADRNFVLQYLKSDRFSKLVKNVKTNNAQPKLAIYAIQSFRMKMPEKAEQQKIAEFLTTVDEKINKLEEKKKGFEKYKKGVMQAIFSQKIRFKLASPAGGKPDGSNYPDWEEKKLCEICQISTAPYVEVNKNLHDGYYLIDMGSVLANGELSSNKHTTSIKNLLRKGELVMPNRDIGHGDIIGKVAEIDQDDKYVLGNNMFCLNGNNNVSNKYLFFVINNQNVNREMRRKSNGTSQLQLIRKDIDSQIIPLPAIEEQKKIAEFLTSLDNKDGLINKQLEQAKLFKKSLLQQMFI